MASSLEALRQGPSETRGPGRPQGLAHSFSHYLSVPRVGFGVWVLRFGVWGLGFGVWSLGSGVWGVGFGVQGLGFRVYRA